MFGNVTTAKSSNRNSYDVCNSSIQAKRIETEREREKREAEREREKRKGERERTRFKIIVPTFF